MADQLPDGGPDWSHLPDHPERFFGLGAAFDRGDLKRAYTRLLRRFKPERHPEEFMRLRAAYERLDAQLCYGPAVEQDADRERGGSRGEPDGPHAAAEPPPLELALPAADAAALVREHGPEAARARLAEAARVEPRLWCAVALLDDALAADPTTLVRTLLTGARESAGEPAVLALLQVALREAHPPQAAAELVQLLADAVARPGQPVGLAPRTYWYLTDHLWLELATRARFEAFAALLARCRRRVGEAGRASELVLLVRLRRRALLRADDAWLAELDRDLDEAARELPPWAEHEVDLARWMGRYRGVRAPFRAAHPFCEELDAALAAILTQDEIAADQACLKALVACVERREELFAAGAALAGPLERSEVLDVALGLLVWYGEQLAARRAEPEPLGPLAVRRALEFTRRLSRRANRTLLGRGWTIAVTSVIVLLLALPVLTGALAARLVGGWVMVPALALCLAVWVASQKGKLGRIFMPIGARFARRLHPRVWQPLTADHLRDARLPYGALLDVLAEDEAETGHFELVAVRCDAALELYSTAVRAVD